MTDYFNLGTYSRSISTDSTEAELWFNRGLIWCYGFNQEEAIRCFNKTIEHDPNCPMGYWGIALANGPFYNKPWEWYGDDERTEAIRVCHHYASEAKVRINQASPLEAALILAIVCKHPEAAVNSNQTLHQWMEDYANSMRGIYQQFGDDLDVICLTVEALINLTPWRLWDFHNGRPSEGSCTEEAMQILEKVFNILNQPGQPLHPGLIHFYIHVYEMSPWPEKALKQANKLRNLVPDGGHLVHMASHIDSLCGDWQSALKSNINAIEVDLKYLARRGTQGFYMIAALHNYEFKMWAAMFLGLEAQSQDAADGLHSLLTDDLFSGKSRYLASTLEGSYSGFVHVMVRFGQWQTIFDYPMPNKPSIYLVTTILLHYAKAIAFATLKSPRQAEQHQTRFKELLGQFPNWHLIHNNPTTDILAVADAMMDGEINYHQGNYDLAFEMLNLANQRHDNLVYCEPWAWMHPPRHALGALLLEQGRPAEAILHYEDDLGISNRLPRCVQHPNNIWALHGYHECLLKLGRKEEAEDIKPQLDLLLEQSDIEITSSCCCRLSL
jgi:tetratricopeptide (TPR) repeat protein